MPFSAHRANPLQNQILAVLDTEQLKRLQRNMQSVSVHLGDVLLEPSDRIRHVYFPQNGALISLLATMEDGKSVEVSLVGNEGAVGIPAILGGDRSGYTALVQGPGDCLKIRVGDLKAEFDAGGVLHDSLLRYIRYLLAQISQTAACNRLHRLEQRFARWLLMVHDRAKKDEFPVTHEFLSLMLGAPRSEVSVVAGNLRKSWCIRYWRGKVTILDRQGLEKASCECYRAVAGESSPPREKKELQVAVPISKLRH